MPDPIVSPSLEIRVPLACWIVLSLCLTASADAQSLRGDGPYVPQSHLRPGASGAKLSELREFVASIPDTIPREFASDLLLRAADAARSGADDGDWLVSTYERAFTLAGGAQSRINRAVLPWAYSNTLEAITAAGHEFGLDTNSLRARAIRGLLRIDPPRTLALLERSTSAVPPLSCADTLRFDVTEPYRALADVVRQFEQESRDSRDRELTHRARALLAARIAAIASSSEIAPALAVLLAARVPLETSEELWTVIADRLHALRDDDRTFSASLPGNWMVTERALSTLYAARSPSLLIVMEAFRQYLVTHLATRRCGLFGADAQAVVSMESQVIVGVNDWLKRTRMAPIAATEIRGSHTIPSAGMKELWRSEPASHLHQALQDLAISWTVSGSGAAAATENQRALMDFEQALSAWMPNDEPSVGIYFHQRLVLLTQLASLDQSIRADAIAEIATMLKTAAGQMPNVQWFAHVGALLDWARDANEMSAVLQGLDESGEPTLKLYARLERLLNTVSQ